mgnify:FL=1
MDLFKKFVKRIDDDFGYDNEKLARDLLKIAEEHQSLQLQQTGVSGRSEQLCGNLDENYNCKNMCLTHCIDGNKFYK